jgi:hypothetical protein
LAQGLDGEVAPAAASNAPTHDVPQKKSKNW